MKLTLRIDFLSGESKDIECSTADLVKFEQKFDLSVARLDAEMKITHLLFLAWASESRTKKTDKSFDEWLELVSSIGASDIDPK